MKSGNERSVCFDAAAGYYDTTRSLPADGRERVMDLVVAEVTGRGPCLDIGVGTGRVALPLLDAGIDVVGLDLSLPMMQQVQEKAGGHSPFPLIGGDATLLPFREEAFGSALIIHVLHSVPRWHGVLQEAVRVTRTGGTVVVDPGNGVVPILDAIEARFIEEIAQQPRRSEWTIDTLDEVLIGLGCIVRPLPDVLIQFKQSPAAFLRRLEEGKMSWQWELDLSAFRPAAERVRSWATSMFGSLDEERALTSAVSMRAYDCLGVPSSK